MTSFSSVPEWLRPRKYLDRIFYDFVLPCCKYISPDETTEVLSKHEDGQIISLKNSFALYLPFNTSRKVVIYSHGNNTTVNFMARQLEAMRSQFGMSICAYEFPVNSTADTINDTIEETYSKLIDDFDYQPQDIILLGKSIGTGPTVHLASQYKCGAVILVSPYASISSLLDDYNFLLRYVCPDCWDSISVINDITAPVFIIHGDEDEVISIDHSYKLFEQCVIKPQMRIVEGGYHNLANDDDIIGPILTSLV
jgi:pimeloyl-ACP methyl ester carboxylesterase